MMHNNVQSCLRLDIPWGVQEMAVFNVLAKEKMKPVIHIGKFLIDKFFQA